MRLTLRTLIAWLDDTLTPSEVKAIGQQVSESPFAKELVERVHRVTRQRRLTVPDASGPDATDPNLVASYLDNELSAEQVAELEKRCLTSDVHLAEVASVHQILSLIGHKAKVPAETKARMSRLVRGREASRADPGRPIKPADAAKQEVSQAPARRPITSWSNVDSGRRKPLEKYGSPAAVFFLILILGATALYSLRPEPGGSLPLMKGSEPIKTAQPQASPDVAQPPERPLAVAAPPPTTTATAPATTKAAPVISDDAPRTFEAIQGVVLRLDPGANAYTMTAAKAPFDKATRLLDLAPFRNVLKLGKSSVELVGAADVQLEDPDREQPPRLGLNRGRLVAVDATPSAPVSLRFESHVLTLSSATNARIGVERLATLAMGQVEPSPARLRIFVPDGQATLRVGDSEEVVDGPAAISLQTSGRFAEKSRHSAPAWVVDPSTTALEGETGRQFVTYFREGRPVLSDIVEAMDDPSEQVRRLAVEALGSIGDMESVVTGLDRKNDRAIHRAVVGVLRDGLALGGEPAKTIRDALSRQYDEMWGKIAERLLIGYRPEDARDEATLGPLVEYLATAPSRGLRELALDDLRALTGRDTLEYDPDNPEGKGLKAWQDLFRKKELTKEARPAR